MADDVFEAGWLELREPVDHRSRAGQLVETLKEARPEGSLDRVVDLGGGTGSNLRYLAPLLPCSRRWTVVDHDPDLLARARTPAGIDVRTVSGDLRDAGLREAESADLVTASALLDLVTRGWLAELARRCAARRTPLLLALSYDGTVQWRTPTGSPDGETEDDRFVARAVNRHQTGAKGMGEALGPDAWRVASELLEGAGYRVSVEASPWLLSGSADAPLLEALVQGWVGAATEVHPEAAGRIHEWAQARIADFRAGRVAVEVGHQDLLALWSGPR